MVYRIVEGRFDEEENSYFCGQEMSPITDFPNREEAERNLKFESFMKYSDLRHIEGGLFRHIPGVEAVFESTTDRIWLIRRVDNLSGML